MSLLVFGGVYTLNKEIKGKSRAIPLRLNAENDAYAKYVKAERRYASLNFTLNKLLEEHRLMIQKYKGNSIKKIKVMMEDFDIKAGDL